MPMFTHSSNLTVDYLKKIIKRHECRRGSIEKNFRKRKDKREDQGEDIIKVY